MPSKLQNITELFNTTLKEISNNPENWTSFLITASNNYKYAFDEQVLIFAQKPEATACADIDTWNKKVKRWVNKGAKGIALLQDFNGLRYVFDVSDTHNYRGTKLKLWKIDSKYNEEVIETLEANFGELENKSDLAEAIISASYNSVEDNLQDYLSELIYSKANSFLEELDEFNIEVKFRTILSNSVAYMTMQRCGINPFDYFSLEDFREIVNFNTIETLANLGTAASDIAETNLRGIHKTIRNLEIKEKNQNRTFEENENLEDTIINKDNERRVSYESRIQYDRRLSNTEFNGRGNEQESKSGQILSNEIKLFEGTKKRIIYGFKNEKRTFKSSFRYTNRSNKQNRKPYQGNDEKREYNRRNEEPRPDEMGSNNEQFETFSRGDSDQRIDLQLNLPTEEEQKSRIADTENVPAIFEFTQEMIDRTIQYGSNFEEGKFRIYKQMTSSLSSKENIEFLKHEYGIGGSSAAYSGADFGQMHDAKGIKLYRGYKDNRPEKLLTWNVVEKRLKELIQIDRYLNPKEKEEYKKWLEEQEKAEKLINEEESENTESKQEDELAERVYSFIKPFDLYNYPDNSILLNTDEDNIEIIKADINDTRNVNDYVNALRKVVENLKDNDVRKHEAKVLLSILEKRLPNYEYHIGDTVYIDADEYEISSIDNNVVTLFNSQFPLFSKQMSFEELENRVKENYSNDHLIEKKQEEIIVEVNTEKEQTVEPIEDIKNLIYEENVLKEEKITQHNEDITEIQKNKPSIVSRKNKIQDFVFHPEILEKEKNNFKIKNDELGIGSPREKFANNIEAIKILKKCEEENRLATVEEQEIMSRYVGWGGLAKAFDDNESSWSNEYNLLKELLSEEEYKDARASVLTAFYTPPIVIKSMYKALETLGVKNANILEPSCGIGNFLGILPDNMKESKLYGIEIDSISGRIAKQLYQKANIVVSGYEKVDLPDSFFDVAIGNVPFGDFKVNDKRYEKNKFLIHDYFFRKDT